jgi:DNA-binding beta-propeller fold protein YncE
VQRQSVGDLTGDDALPSKGTSSAVGVGNNEAAPYNARKALHDSAMESDQMTPGLDIDVGNRAFGVVLSPDGARAYVGSQEGAIVVVDIAARRTVASIAVPGGNGGFSMAVSADGQSLYGPASKLRAVYASPIPPQMY